MCARFCNWMPIGDLNGKIPLAQVSGILPFKSPEKQKQNVFLIISKYLSTEFLDQMPLGNLTVFRSSLFSLTKRSNHLKISDELNLDRLKPTAVLFALLGECLCGCYVRVELHTRQSVEDRKDTTSTKRFEEQMSISFVCDFCEKNVFWPDKFAMFN